MQDLFDKMQDLCCFLFIQNYSECTSKQIRRILKMIPEVKITPIDIMIDGRVRDSVDFEIKTLELNKFVERLNVYYDTEAVFQRDFGWTLEMQAELIRSIMTGNPIGWCWLCENAENVAYKTMIDFKNRSLTIKRFWEGAFKVPLRLFKADGSDEVVYMSWKEMCLSSSPQIKNLVQTFQDYPIQVIIFKGLDLVGMANKWKTVNTYLLMANEEHLYGGNFYVKGLFKAIFDHSIKEIMRRHGRGKQEAYNKKEKGTIFTQRIFYTCFGPLLNDVWAIRCLGNSKSNKTEKPMVRDTENLNQHLAGILQNEKVNCLDERFLRKTKFWEKVELMKRLTSHLIDVLDSNNTVSKNLNKNDLFDIIIFSMNLILEGRLTFSMLRDNKDQYLKLITEYQVSKKEDKTLTGQSVTTKK